jgi:hypothetical protein
MLIVASQSIGMRSSYVCWLHCIDFCGISAKTFSKIQVLLKKLAQTVAFFLRKTVIEAKQIAFFVKTAPHTQLASLC